MRHGNSTVSLPVCHKRVGLGECSNRETPMTCYQDLLLDLLLGVCLW